MSNREITYACDLSALGALRVVGPNAGMFVRTMFTGETDPCDKLFGIAQGLLLTGQAEVIDFVNLVRTGDDEFMVMSCTGNIEEDFEWLQAHAELSDANGPIFADTVVENQTAKLASLVMFGSGADRISQELAKVCKGKVPIIISRMDGEPYAVPSSPAVYVFTSYNLAPQIGEILNDFLDLEVIEYEQFCNQNAATGRFDTRLVDADYHDPYEMNLAAYLRQEGDFVGARGLAILNEHKDLEG